MTARPKLRSDLVLVEQTYRGERSFIVKDPQTRKYFRFRPVEIMVMQALDGEHTTEQAAGTLKQGGINVSSGAVEAFARKLATMGLCERTIGERSVLQMERLRAQRRRRLGGGAVKGDMLRLRWSVGDPDKVFDRWLPRLGFFFTRPFLAISVALFGVYLLILAIKWTEFSQALTNLYTLNVGLDTLAVLWLTGIAIIIVHELGHGFTCKYFGGQVHEIGAMLIYFQPAFFCNVNDAWTFPKLGPRLWVTAAGSWIQLVIASLAAVVWWAAAPGTLVSEIAFAAVLVGGITTVFGNANPLIPLDGYYALSDYLEVPNLRQRAFARLAWLIKTRILGLDLAAPPADEREQRIFMIYAALAVTYIALVLSFVAATVLGRLSEWLGGFGVALFILAALLMLRGVTKGWTKTIRLLVDRGRASVREKPWRRRFTITLAAIMLLGAIVPWPITVAGTFVAAPIVWIPHAAPDSGLIERVLVREGTHVGAGTPLLQLRNLVLERQVLASRRVADSLTVRAAQARGQGRMADVAVTEAHRSVESARLAGLQMRRDALRIRALGSGTVVTPRPEELAGRWVSNGEIVLELGQSDSIEIRIALTGAGGTLVRPGAPVSLLQDATLEPPVRGKVGTVSSAASSPETIEARLRLPAGRSWRPGMTGRARITLRESNLWGALWWSIRRGLRSDILL